MTGPDPSKAYDHEFFEALAERIQAIDLEEVFTITPDGGVVRHEGLHAPEVYHVEGKSHPDDIEILAPYGETWTALAGHTGQHGYNGAVMHSSEFVGCALASALYDEDVPVTYTMVVVNVHDEDAYEGEGHPPEPAGWAILRRG